MPQRPEPFTVAVPEERLARLMRRLADTEWAPDFANDDWAYGVEGTYLRELVDYWQHSYDWRAMERSINAFPQHRVELGGVPVHFIHQRGAGPRPLALILSHGWPWTFWDLSRVIGPLSDPAAYGGDQADAFDVVVPSLPGFGFSTPLTQPGWNFWRTADLWVQLMSDVLGYERFGAQGGDWGALVSAQLGHKYAGRVIGVHLTNAIPLDLFNRERPWDLGGPIPADVIDPGRRAALVARQRRIASHVAVHVCDPQTLGWALHDSPVGLLAWLLERRRAWGDCNGNVESRFPKDFMLTTAMIYWAGGGFVTSARYYREAAAYPWSPSHDRRPVVESPTGITFLAPDSGPGPTAYHREYFNLTYHRSWPRGGHFAAWEEPDVVVEDIRATFRPLR
jgi:microsomal epoxide hydrolase